MLLDNDVSAADPTAENLSRSRMMLAKLSKAWPRRAYAKRQELEPFFEDGKEDFLESLLPFRDMPQYQESSPEMKSRILSCGWLIYNAKTVQIETAIVNPVCLRILQRELPGLEGTEVQRAVCETMVDESYHVHLVEQASRLTRQRRGLEHVVVPQFNLVRHMERRERGFDDPRQKRMVEFATAVVSEIFISDYLHLLSETTEIQEFNRMTVAAHRHDELAHSPLFRALAHLLAADLTKDERDTFGELMPEPVLWFADQELDTWLSVLKQIDFPDAEKMINDCRDAGRKELALDYSGVVSLAEEIGVLDTAVKRDSFAKHGLVT
jgi:alpha-N-dichloroacetyl-p-aminophenylserinol N-oxygenase